MQTYPRIVHRTQTLMISIASRHHIYIYIYIYSVLCLYYVCNSTLIAMCISVYLYEKTLSYEINRKKLWGFSHDYGKLHISVDHPIFIDMFHQLTSKKNMVSIKNHQILL